MLRIALFSLTLAVFVGLVVNQGGEPRDRCGPDDEGWCFQGNNCPNGEVPEVPGGAVEECGFGGRACDESENAKSCCCAVGNETTTVNPAQNDELWDDY